MWDDSLSVGIQKFDDDHKRLVTLINSVYLNFIDGVSAEKSEEILNELVAYTDYHFRAEEHVMTKLEYPEAQKHKDEHKHFTDRVLHLKQLYESGILTIDKELLVFINGWVSFHITKADVELSKFIYEHIRENKMKTAGG
jgi:hemerythrin-like metal-binding protein